MSIMRKKVSAIVATSFAITEDFAIDISIIVTAKARFVQLLIKKEIKDKKINNPIDKIGKEKYKYIIYYLFSR